MIEELADDMELDDIEPSPEEVQLYEHFRVTVDKGQDLVRVDKYLFDKLTNVSRNRIQKAADAGYIMANEKPVKSNYRVKPLDVITVMLDRPYYDNEVVPEDIPLNIVYEDDVLMVVNKPAGMVVHPGHGNYTGTLINGVAWHMKDVPNWDMNDAHVGLVHRIDKDTSGLLVIAKTPEAKTHLGEQFFNKTTKRRYQALVWGNFEEDEGTVVGNIGRNPKDRHMKHIGHVLFNDERYGGQEVLRGNRTTKYKQFINNCFEICPRQALHAMTLGFIHPVTGEEMYFTSELPEDMTALLDKWRNYYKSELQ